MIRKLEKIIEIFSNPQGEINNKRGNINKFSRISLLFQRFSENADALERYRDFLNLQSSISFEFC